MTKEEWAIELAAEFHEGTYTLLGANERGALVKHHGAPQGTAGPIAMCPLGCRSWSSGARGARTSAEMCGTAPPTRMGDSRRSALLPS